MKRKLLVLFLFSIITNLVAQDVDRSLLRGTVIYRDVNVPGLDVTDKDGDFAIAVKLGDQLAFTAVNYQIQIVIITEAILTNNRLVIDVKEKVTELDEVVVSPENQEKFINLKNEQFKEVEYEQDETSSFVNVAQSQIDAGMQNGINFVNIFKALLKSKKDKKDTTEPKLKLSTVLRQVYEDDFFVTDLGLPQDKIDDFLLYCDDKIPSQDLFKKDNEFQLIDFLVTHSKTYLKL